MRYLNTATTYEERPAFGLGEDWNDQQRAFTEVRAELERPAFGLGEDWNMMLDVNVLTESMERPAFGLGEDWNLSCQ